MGGGSGASELNYAKQNLTDRDLRKILSEKAHDKPDYLVIDFSENRLTTAGLEEILDIGRRCSRLRVLKVYKNEICDRGAEALVGLIRECKAIEEIHLSHNKLTVDGIALILTAASKRPSKLAPLWLRVEHNDVDNPHEVIRELGSELSVCTIFRETGKCNRSYCKYSKKVHLPFFLNQKGKDKGKGKGKDNGKDDGKGKEKSRGRERRSSHEWDDAAYEEEGPRKVVLTARSGCERSDSQDSFRDGTAQHNGHFRHEEHRRSRSRPCRNGNRHIRVGSKDASGSGAPGSAGDGGASPRISSRRHERVRDNGTMDRRRDGTRQLRHRGTRDRAEYAEKSRGTGTGRRRRSDLSRDELADQRRVGERPRRRRSDAMEDGRDVERAKRPRAHPTELGESRSGRVSSRHAGKRHDMPRQQPVEHDDGIGAAWAGVPGGPKPKASARRSPLSPPRTREGAGSVRDALVTPAANAAAAAAAAAENGSVSISSSSEVSDTDLDEAEEIDPGAQTTSTVPPAAQATAGSAPKRPSDDIPVGISPDGDSSLSPSCSEDDDNAPVPAAAAVTDVGEGVRAQEEQSSSPSQTAPHDPYCDVVEYGDDDAGECPGSPSSEQRWAEDRGAPPPSSPSSCSQSPAAAGAPDAAGSAEPVPTKVQERMQSLKERLTQRLQGSQ